jgi:hypothetical protein
MYSKELKDVLTAVFLTALFATAKRSKAKVPNE